MRSWPALLFHELRNARASLAFAAFLTVACLTVLHVTDAGPIQTATALPLLWCLCALQFASDSFATDLASGRLSTRAALPIGSRSLWTTKLAGVAASIASIWGFGFLLELGWQRLTGGEYAASQFTYALPSAAEVLPVLALIVAAGMLCSLVVESALTAMLLTGLVLGALWGLGRLIEDSVHLIGTNFASEHPGAVALACATAMLVVGHIAFTRAERKLGNGSIRVRAVLVGALVTVLCLAGTVTGTSWHFARYGLEDPRTQLFLGVASPDGRFLAFLSSPILSGIQERLCSAWVIDLETGESRVLAAPGRLGRDFYTGNWRAWTEQEGLAVLAEQSWAWGGNASAFRLHARGSELREVQIAEPKSFIEGTPPDWALVTRGRKPRSETRFVHVRWLNTPHERTFEGDGSETLVGHSLVLSPTPGRVLWRKRDKRLLLVDLESGEERVVMEGCEGLMDVSPDAKAILIRTEDEIHVLSTEDGSPLREPWVRKECMPQWIPGDDRSHELMVMRLGRRNTYRILDLEHGREVELDSSDWYLARVGERGYVHFDVRGDLVWIDREGKLVKVLIDRGGV